MGHDYQQLVNQVDDYITLQRDAYKKIKTLLLFLF